MTLSQNQLKEKLHYCDKTGIFTHLTKTTHKDVGDTAGYIHSRGYRHIRVNAKEYKAHRLAWLYVYGEFPKGVIDHKNRVKDANWITNLRDTSQLINNRNATLRKDSPLGLAGVTYSPHCKYSKYTVRINNNHLGSHESLFEAACIATSYRNKLWHQYNYNSTPNYHQ